MLTNRANQPITEFYASPASTDDWGENRLGQDTLAPAKQLRIRLGANRECEWDLQVIYADSAHEENRGVNLCRTQQVAFDGSTAERPSRGEERTLTVENRTNRRIDEIYLSPSDADGWDDDRLPTTLPPGESAAITYRGGCTADLRIVYETRAAEERREINVCDLGKVVVSPGWALADDPSKTAALPPPATAPEPAAPPAAPSPPSSPGAEIPKAPPAAAAETLSILNRSGKQMVELYVFPDGAARGTDLLGLSVLPDGGDRPVPFDRGTGCSFTVHAVFAGSQPDLDRRGLDLCKGRNVTVQGQDATAAE